MFAQHAIACVLCELLCLELFNVFFQHENRFRYKFFDIVQFSRSCKHLSHAADSLFILPPKRQIVKHFFEDFLKFLGEPIDLRTFPVTFSEVFVPDVRLTVMYFSTDPLKKQVLFSLFLNYFAVRPFAQFFLSDLAALSIIRPTACPASPLISCAPAGRSVPAWYGAVLPYRSGSCPHKSEAG